MQYGIILLLALLSQPVCSLTFLEVRGLIENQGLSKIEDVLPRLPADFRSRFVLVYQSRSLQEATAEDPRVIFYDQKGEFFLSVNGDSEKKGGSLLEMIEQRPNRAGANFYSIDFSGRKPEFHTNPRRCFTCHTSMGHTNWDSYDLWPGVYGSFDGRGGFLKSLTEEVALGAFFKSADQHLRYKHLKTGAGGVSYKELAERNEEFTQTLYRVQAKRLARLVRASRRFESLKNAWLSPATGEGFSGVLPEALKKKTEILYRKAVGYLCERILTVNARRLKRQITITENENEKASHQTSDLLPLDGVSRALALSSLMGIEEDFKLLASPTVDRESYSSFDGGPGFWTYFYEELAEGSPAPLAILSGGGTARLVQDQDGFKLSKPHPTCGDFHWP